MAIKIISDIHGEYDSLAHELNRDDTAVLLGDYLNMIDFQTLDGILTQVFSRQVVSAVLAVLANSDSELIQRAVRDNVELPSGTQEKLSTLMREGYQEFFKVLSCRCLMLFGNTDDPLLLEELKGKNVELFKAGSLELKGQIFGFVSGAPMGKRAIGLPGEISREEYDELVESLGRVDVLCTHFPPAVPDLTWDVVADRDEYGSTKLLSYIEEYKPQVHYFGHVHNPRIREMVYGSTKLINAGFFRAHRKALQHTPSKLDLTQ